MNFLLELLTEEIPARMQARAAEQLRVRFGDGIAGKLPGGEIETHVTPRRLILYARGLGAEGNAQQEERRGPRTDAPAQAIEGFVRSTGLPRDALEERDTPKGKFLYATIRTPGRSAAEVIAELIPQIVRDFDWPKSMRWGDATAASPRWVRPLSSIVALLDDEIVAFEAAGIPSGRTTRGHRFMARGALEIASAATYAGQLRDANVLIDAAERARIIADGAQAAAAAAGLTLIDDAGLIAENAGLTEWPVPLLGRFDPAFLDVPAEVIQLTMRTNQKYFACSDGQGALAPAFVCVAGLVAPDGGRAIVAGNEKVLAARLSDAKFFWDQDRATTLESRLPKLEKIKFHDRLWSLKRKVNRVTAIVYNYLPEMVGWPEAKAREMQPALKRAAQLAKADLVSSMVGEFPELQGVMGGYYADHEGLAIGDAIRDQYKPVGPSDQLPRNEIGTLLALADKVDTLYSFFAIGERPTGSKDPYALRRAALGIIRLILENGFRLSLTRLYDAADFERLFESDGVNFSKPTDALVAFTVDRLKVQQREAGIRSGIIDAVFALGGEDDLVRLLARVRALQTFIDTDDGANLLAGYRRAANILRIEEAKGDTFAAAPDPALLTDPAERALANTLTTALAAATDAVTREAFEEAMTALSRLRAPVDRFFDAVMVNDPDPATRANRLNLLASFRAAVHNVADFSKIEG